MSFVTLLSVLGVAVGVLSVFGTQSVMNGFHAEIARKLIDTGGQGSISANGVVLSERQIAYIEGSLKKNPDVAKVEKVALGAVMMMYQNVPVYPILRSYDTLTNECVMPIVEKDFIRYGDIENLDDDSIILSIRFARTLGINIGDIVEVFAPTMIEKYTKEEVPLPVKLKLVGFIYTDFSKFDENFALVSLRRMQELYGLGKGCHQISFTLKNGVDVTEFAKKWNEQRENYSLQAHTWLTGNRDFLNVIVTEKVMMSLIMMMIIIVAAFAICAFLWITVLRKTKEIGLIAAMGARPWQIAACYCLQGFLIGILGVIVGLIFTYVLLQNRDPIAGFIVGKDTLSQFYFFSKLPVEYSFTDGFRTCTAAIILCTLAGFLPALRASRLKASEAMRNE